MFKKIIKINFFFIFLTTLVFADIIKDIKISGNQRISDQTIIVYGNIELNKEYNNKELNNILKNLYTTNFFKTININIESTTLNIIIEENPIIESISINGIKKKSLSKRLLDQVSLKERTSYIDSFFVNDINLITNIIKNSGYYFVKIKNSKIFNKELNTVQISYDINLGPKAKITNIEFLGDKKIKDRKLKSLITSEEDKFWKFISNNSYLDENRIELDNRLILNYYKNNGYYFAKVENSFVEFINDGTFKLIFNINAGKKYFFNDFNLVMPDSYDRDKFLTIISAFDKLKNKPYSPLKLNKVLNKIDKIALLKEFQFINSSFKETVTDNDKININIELENSDAFYVEKINILGNQYTLENVIRNSLIVDEGDAFNEILFNNSLNNLKSKGYFGSVESSVKGGTNIDQKIIDITVVEQPTGEISLGAGIGSSGGSIGGGIRENNFMGKGIKLDTNLNISANAIKGSFNYERPHFRNSDNSLLLSVSNTSTDNLKKYGYKSNNFGFSIGTAMQQYDNLTFRPSILFDYETLKTSSKASASLQKQKGTYADTYFNYSLDYDLRDLKYQTTQGSRTIFLQNLPITSNRSEITNSLQHDRYRPLVNEMIGKISFFTQAVSTISSKDVRISKRLYIPSKKLRGFESGKVGPIDNGDYVGGNFITAVNMATTLPQLLPNAQNTDFSLFFDAASIWGVDYDSSIKDDYSINSSIGISLDVTTVIGPLNFSLAQPISKKDSDKTETFRFNIGTTF
jgi:outer membrane protein insertion porin family